MGAKKDYETLKKIVLHIEYIIIYNVAKINVQFNSKILTQNVLNGNVVCNPVDSEVNALPNFF